MDKQTEFEIRAQSTIKTLRAHMADAMEGCIHLQTEIAVRDARIIELQNELESMKNAAPT
jgi:hypothetical protein